MKLLHIDSSALGANSATRELTAAVVDARRASVPALEVTYRDLDARPVAHLSGRVLDGDTDAADESAQVLAEFLEADTVVIGAPMYNFAIPSTLKAWVDRIAVAGKTFRYTANGPEGLAGGKTIVVATAAGGLHAGQPSDFVEPYLRHLFGFLGVTDVSFLRADGVALSPAHRREAIDTALGDVRAPRRAA